MWLFQGTADQVFTDVDAVLAGNAQRSRASHPWYGTEAVATVKESVRQRQALPEAATFACSFYDTATHEVTALPYLHTFIHMIGASNMHIHVRARARAYTCVHTPSDRCQVVLGSDTRGDSPWTIALSRCALHSTEVNGTALTSLDIAGVRWVCTTR